CSRPGTAHRAAAAWRQHGGHRLRDLVPAPAVHQHAAAARAAAATDVAANLARGDGDLLRLVRGLVARERVLKATRRQGCEATRREATRPRGCEATCSTRTSDLV